MTRIIRTENCIKRFKKDFEKGLFKKSDAEILGLWYQEMSKFGSKFIAESKEWRDHPLLGPWNGYRASSFSFEGRIIYRLFYLIENDEVVEICEVERVTPDHNYERRR